jgi:hypothetical protein
MQANYLQKHQFTLENGENTSKTPSKASIYAWK